MLLDPFDHHEDIAQHWIFIVHGAADKAICSDIDGLNIIFYGLQNLNN